MEGYLVLVVFLGVAVLLGLRIGRKWSGIAACLCVVGLIIAAVIGRIELAETGRATQILMLSGFAGGLFLRLALAFAGPAFFQRWTFALALSTALNVALSFVPWPAISFLLLGVTGPESFGPP